MKCWKCGKEIPDGASMCTYCSASMNRKAPATPAGKAMRQIYDRFGSGRVFDKKSILSIALGDMLEDSKKIRSQIDMVMSAGVGGVYLNQLQNVGKPDSAFCDKIKKLMTDEAGLSDKVAAELMGYFDEMIGWNSLRLRPAVQRRSPDPLRRTRFRGLSRTRKPRLRLRSTGRLWIISPRLISEIRRRLPLRSSLAATRPLRSRTRIRSRCAQQSWSTRMHSVC